MPDTPAHSRSRELVDSVAPGEVLRQRHPRMKRHRPAHELAAVDVEVTKRSAAACPGGDVNRALNAPVAQQSATPAAGRGSRTRLRATTASAPGRATVRCGCGGRRSHPLTSPSSPEMRGPRATPACRRRHQRRSRAERSGARGCLGARAPQGPASRDAASVPSARLVRRIACARDRSPEHSVGREDRRPRQTRPADPSRRAGLQRRFCRCGTSRLDVRTSVRAGHRGGSRHSLLATTDGVLS